MPPTKSSCEGKELVSSDRVLAAKSWRDDPDAMRRRWREGIAKSQLMWDCIRMGLDPPHPRSEAEAKICKWVKDEGLHPPSESERFPTFESNKIFQMAPEVSASINDIDDLETRAQVRKQYRTAMTKLIDRGLGAEGDEDPADLFWRTIDDPEGLLFIRQGWWDDVFAKVLRPHTEKLAPRKISSAKDPPSALSQGAPSNPPTTKTKGKGKESRVTTRPKASSGSTSQGTERSSRPVTRAQESIFSGFFTALDDEGKLPDVRAAIDQAMSEVQHTLKSNDWHPRGCLSASAMRPHHSKDVLGSEEAMSMLTLACCSSDMGLGRQKAYTGSMEALTGSTIPRTRSRVTKSRRVKPGPESRLSGLSEQEIVAIAVAELQASQETRNSSTPS